jgi:hypothetical protein
MSQSSGAEWSSNSQMPILQPWIDKGNSAIAKRQKQEPETVELVIGQKQAVILAA